MLAVDAADLGRRIGGRREEAAPFCATAWIAAGVLAASRYHGLWCCTGVFSVFVAGREDHSDDSSCPAGYAFLTTQ